MIFSYPSIKHPYSYNLKKKQTHTYSHLLTYTFARMKDFKFDTNMKTLAYTDTKLFTKTIKKGEKKTKEILNFNHSGGSTSTHSTHPPINAKIFMFQLPCLLLNKTENRIWIIHPSYPYPTSPITRYQTNPQIYFPFSHS